MEFIYIVLILFVIYVAVTAFFTDRSPIPETSGHVHKISNNEELETLLSANKQVVVDFYADWCPPCRTIAPVFSKLADEHASKGSLAFAKVNVDHVQNVSGRYGVTAMPTFAVFRDGKPTGVAVEGIQTRKTVNFTDDGLVDRIRGADPVALKAVVQALSSKK